MKAPILAFLTLFSAPAFAQEITGVLVNPYTGYVGALIVVGEAKIQPKHLLSCGSGCQFTAFMTPGQCMIVSVSRKEGAFGYNFGPANDLAHSRQQAHRYCQNYGGSQCKEYQAICG